MDAGDRLYLYLKITTAFGLGLLAVSLLGEFLGWWNDWGEAGATVGGIVGIIGVPLTLWWGPSRKQVRAVGEAMIDSREKLENVADRLKDVGAEVEEVGAKVEIVGVKVETVGGKIERQTEVLVQIRDRL
jgi:hypothetical protein